MSTTDTHCHVISDDPVRYPPDPIGGTRSGWSKEHPVTAEGLVAAMDGAGIARAVVVQASTCYGHDNSYLADSVGRYPDRLVGVFSVDPLAPGATAQLARWTAEGLVGARVFTTGSTMPGQAPGLSDERAFPAWAWAGEHRLPICLQMRPQGIPALRELLDRFPDATVVLDHLARPDLTGGPPYAAAESLFRLARYDGVFLKLTERNIAASPETFIRRLLDEFGADRIMWGSNFPAAGHPLAELHTTSRDTLANLAEATRRAIFDGTAERVYPALAKLAPAGQGR